MHQMALHLLHVKLSLSNTDFLHSLYSFEFRIFCVSFVTHHFQFVPYSHSRLSIFIHSPYIRDMMSQAAKSGILITSFFPIFNRESKTVNRSSLESRSMDRANFVGIRITFILPKGYKKARMNRQATLRVNT